jgi:ATP-dependent DNA helicase RecG
LGFIEAKGQGRQTYYVPTEKLKFLYANDATSDANDATSDANNATSDANDATSDANDATSDANDATSDANEWDNVPKDLKDIINHLGKRESKAKLGNIIVELCRIQPRSKEDLAKILGKSETHIRNNILPELLKSRLLQYTFPEMKNHPNQKYTAENRNKATG